MLRVTLATGSGDGFTAIQKSTVGFMSTTLRCSIHFVDLEVS